MGSFAPYADRYENIRMHREDGIIEVALHTDGGPLVWSEPVHRELGYAFEDIGTDRDNRIMILTGTGDTFSGEIARHGWGEIKKPSGRDKVYWEGKRLLRNLLEIEIPIISAVNGPAHQHAELAALGDIVLASETASFKDPHFSHGRVPGDGVHVVWPILLGPNRARYFQMMGQVLSANEAHELGVVAEVLAPGDLMPRAWEIARQLAQNPDLQLRYTRVVLTMQLLDALEPAIGYGLALENLAALHDAEIGRPAVTDPK